MYLVFEHFDLLGWAMACFQDLRYGLHFVAL